MFTLIEKIYLIVVALTFLCSLVSFRLHYPSCLRFFSVFLGITALTELVANFFPGSFHLSSNYPVYNIFLLIQFLSLSFYLQSLIRSTFYKKAITVSMLLYPVFWIVTSLVAFTLYHWNTYALMLGDLIIIVLTSRYLFELFTGNELISLTQYAEFWIAIGIWFYSCCELPITGMLNYIVKDWSLARRLLTILQVLNILMYLIFIYAYLCRIKPTVKKSLS